MEIHIFNDKQCRSRSIQKPTDLDQHCLLRQNMSCLVREGLNNQWNCYGVIFGDNSGIFFSFLHKNICCRYTLEVPQGGTSNEYQQHRLFFGFCKRKIVLALSPKSPALQFLYFGDYPKYW